MRGDGRQPRRTAHAPRASWLPHGLDHLLLDVALNPTERGARAWHHLRPHMVFDDITGDQTRLMPLVHRSLTALGIDDSDLGRMKGLHRNTWYRNQMLLARIEPTLHTLRNNDIDVMVMKGLPLGLGYYADIGLRPMMDADVLVPFGRFLDAISILRTCGFTVKSPSSTNFPLYNSAVTARHPDGTQIDMHWQVHRSLGLCGAPAAWGPNFWNTRLPDDEFWQRAEDCAVGSIICRAPSPEDLLLHVCVHGAYTLNGHALRWAADAAMILRSGRPLQWSTLVDQSQRRRVALEMSQALDYISTELDVHVPDDVLAAFHAIRPSAREQFVHRTRTGLRQSAGVRSGLGRFAMITLQEPLPRVAAAFPRYLAAVSGANSFWQLPINLPKRLLRGPQAVGIDTRSGG